MTDVDAASYHVDVVLVLEGCADCLLYDLEEAVMGHVVAVAVAVVGVGVLQLVVHLSSKHLLSKYLSVVIPGSFV